MGNAWKTRIGPALAGIGGFMPLNLIRLEAEGVDLAERQEWVPAVQTLRGGVRVTLPMSRGWPAPFVSAEIERGDVERTAYALGFALINDLDVQVEYRSDEHWFGEDGTAVVGAVRYGF